MPSAQILEDLRWLKERYKGQANGYTDACLNRISAALDAWERENSDMRRTYGSHPLFAEERAKAFEEAAKIVEGDALHDGAFRSWPSFGTGNRSRDDETVRLTQSLAAAIRERIAKAVV